MFLLKTFIIKKQLKYKKEKWIFFYGFLKNGLYVNWISIHEMSELPASCWTRLLSEDDVMVNERQIEREKAKLF
jgi:hypothetical protein